jgi:hypothetical protein
MQPRASGPIEKSARRPVRIVWRHTDDEPPTRRMRLEEVAALNLGVAVHDRLVTGVFVFMLRWEVAATERASAGLSLDDLADFWGESVRSVYRALRTFRIAFSGETNPNRLLLQCAHGRNRAAGWRGIAQFTVSVDG